jgi:hypothetical protein
VDHQDGGEHPKAADGISGGLAMRFGDLDPVVLDVDIPEYGLPKRSLGAVVQVHASDAYEVEFVAAKGATAALLTLTASQLRKPSDDDLICVSQIGVTHNRRSRRRRPGRT